VEPFTHGYGHVVREVGGSNPGRGTIVGGVFHSTRQLARFSALNKPAIVNSRDEAVTDHYASPSFEVGSHLESVSFLC